MFNPKGSSLLEDQLAVSGLEMNIFGAIGAVASVAGGIFGAASASSQNSKNAAAAKKQQKLLDKQAKINNEYNAEAHEAEKHDYFAQREFQFDMANRQFEYDNTIQDYTYLQNVKQYGKSVDQLGNQLVYNSLAAHQAYESTQSQFQELLASQSFAKENLFVERLQNQGAAAVGQAGRGQTKAQQVTLADEGRNLAVLQAELRSGETQAGRQMRDIGIQKYAGDKNAIANLMLRPEKAPRPMAPVMGPERTFVKPAEQIPGMAPPPAYSNPLMPLIGGISSAASTLQSTNFGSSPTPTPLQGTSVPYTSLF
jgi:hypothetical protein